MACSGKQTATLYRVTAPADPVLVHGNRLLGSEGAAAGPFSAKTRAPATVGGALPENAMERVDIATDQTGFPDGDEQNSALCVAGTDCGLGGRVQTALTQGVVLSEN
jgi:hypothetical protein